MNRKELELKFSDDEASPKILIHDVGETCGFRFWIQASVKRASMSWLLTVAELTAIRDMCDEHLVNLAAEALKERLAKREAEAQEEREAEELAAMQQSVESHHRFPNTYCSQCGGEFGPGDHGFSHCENHGARAA